MNRRRTLNGNWDVKLARRDWGPNKDRSLTIYCIVLCGLHWGPQVYGNYESGISHKYRNLLFCIPPFCDMAIFCG